ncbi:ArsR/SmtB family transcription factor [Puniceicoccus vermicola]|uniref:Metalloregulator ArsR/SmtB family transcription factor n=1 Tax=Puniceicoccus vermicola TaxID=388746 RepID=A0A7X1E3G3_9BACT|nr:metalloregulator ArsR/SmtB family transcription factor [Puniceicoccus vermicola]MBC2600949.1 metalloregulator ArsR/SmtB family transcription factor [Puniceicoccus vermicola]
MAEGWETLRLLSEPTRARILSLVRREELTVAELQEILGMGQSRISSHLGLLRQGNLVSDRREGKHSFYGLNPSLGGSVRNLVDSALAVAEEDDLFAEDARNLERILARRKQVAEKYFNLVAGRLGRSYCPGRSWQALGHFLLLLSPRIRVADLGAGEGMISQLLARNAEKVFCIDSSPRMVEVGKELAEKNGLKNLQYKLGDIEDVPMKDGSVDLAILSQALHHAEKPKQAISEAFRILKPGGRLAVLDLDEHNFEKARELYADKWLGFSENELYQFLRDAGFRSVEVTPVSREEQEPGFVTLLATGLKPSA